MFNHQAPFRPHLKQSTKIHKLSLRVFIFKRFVVNNKRKINRNKIKRRLKTCQVERSCNATKKLTISQKTKRNHCSYECGLIVYIQAPYRSNFATKGLNYFSRLCFPTVLWLIVAFFIALQWCRSKAQKIHKRNSAQGR